MDKIAQHKLQKRKSKTGHSTHFWDLAHDRRSLSSTKRNPRTVTERPPGNIANDSHSDQYSIHTFATEDIVNSEAEIGQNPRTVATRLPDKQTAENPRTVTKGPPGTAQPATKGNTTPINALPNPRKISLNSPGKAVVKTHLKRKADANPRTVTVMPTWVSVRSQPKCH